MKNLKKVSANKGFTLIEILVVIGIIAVLAAVVIIAINPARQFAQARDTQRTANINAILNAIGQELADKKGVANSEITTTEQAIDDDEADLCDDLMPKYLPSFPTDPDSEFEGASLTSCPASYDTGYHIEEDANGRITVSAPFTEVEADTEFDTDDLVDDPAEYISVTR